MSKETSKEESMIFCKVLKENLPKMSAPPFKGELGVEVASTISQQAWDKWTEVQTMLINENRLNLMNESDRDFIKNKLRDYISGNEVEKPKDYKA